MNNTADKILKWYDQNRRKLPWRSDPDVEADPYRVWLSEIMLQQTNVATVKSYFLDFIDRWPKLEDLAATSLDEVLHAWQGLGYYARARNLYKCARIITSFYDGQFPSEEKELLKLPGIGPYTAAAIAAIAFDKISTPIDGNIERIISRLYAIKDPPPKSKKKIRMFNEASYQIQKSTSISEGGMVDINSILQLAELIEPNGRIAGEFSQNSETSKNFILKDGDSILVPSLSYEVVVQGEVLNSSSFIYDKSMNFKEYIDAAGGFSEYADKRAVFIIKANGLSVSAGNNIFSGTSIIEPGDTIVVPRNLDQLEPLPVISMATKIIADIAFSAASLNAIQD